MSLVASELSGLGSVLTGAGTPAPAAGGITQLTGPVTAGPGSGAQATTVTPNAITNAMLAQVATATWKGRHTAATGDVEDGTMPQLAALLAVAAAGIGFCYVAEVDATVVGTNVIVPAVAGKVALVTRYALINSAVAGAASTAATMRVGNPSSPANIVAATALTLTTGQHAAGLNAATNLNAVATLAPYVTGESLNLGITVGATGTGGFIFKVKFAFFGVYV